MTTEQWLCNLCNVVEDIIDKRQSGVGVSGGDLFATGIGQGVILKLTSPILPTLCHSIERELNSISAGYTTKVSGTRVVFFPESYEEDVNIIDGEIVH